MFPLASQAPRVKCALALFRGGNTLFRFPNLATNTIIALRTAQQAAKRRLRQTNHSMKLGKRARVAERKHLVRSEAVAAQKPQESDTTTR